MWLAYFVEFPDYLTQGETLEELQENLRDLYGDLTAEISRGFVAWSSSPSDEMDRFDPQARRSWLELVRRGGDHDWYRPVPRHREVNEFLAKHT